MRRVLLTTAAILALGTAFAGTAQARCGVSCLNRKVKQLSSALIKNEKTIASLSKTVAQQGQTIAAQTQTINQQSAAINALAGAAKFATLLEKCLFEVPLNRYGDPAADEGYLYETLTETFKTTALDVVEEGEGVGAWFLIDGCNPLETASIKAAARRFP
jgi:uncharacterized coiled-coil protein SlyX